MLITDCSAIYKMSLIRINTFKVDYSPYNSPGVYNFSKIISLMKHPVSIVTWVLCIYSVCNGVMTYLICFLNVMFICNQRSKNALNLKQSLYRYVHFSIIKSNDTIF